MDDIKYKLVFFYDNGKTFTTPRAVSTHYLCKTSDSYFYNAQGFEDGMHIFVEYYIPLTNLLAVAEYDQDNNMKIIKVRKSLRQVNALIYKNGVGKDEFFVIDKKGQP